MGRDALTPAEQIETLRYKLFCQLRSSAPLEKCRETWREIDAIWTTMLNTASSNGGGK